MNDYCYPIFTQHKDTQHYDTQRNKAQSNYTVITVERCSAECSHSSDYAECRYADSHGANALCWKIKWFRIC
jgi:hypothetical protein